MNDWKDFKPGRPLVRFVLDFSCHYEKWSGRGEPGTEFSVWGWGWGRHAILFPKRHLVMKEGILGSYNLGVVTGI